MPCHIRRSTPQSVPRSATVCIYDAGGCGRVGIDEVAVLVSLVIGTFRITIAERGLDSREGRDGLAVALQLALAFLIGRLDSVFDFSHRCRVALGDDEADAVLGSAAVDALRLSDIGVAPASLNARDNLGRIVKFCHCGFLLNCP